MAKDIHCPECGCVIGGDTMSADPQRRRFFAIIRDIHHNLPDAMLEQFTSPEHLRKRALIAAGWCDVNDVIAGSKSAAPGIAEAFRMMDRYCVTIVRGDVVRIYRARSIARRVLLKKDFHSVASKAFEWIARQTGIDGERSIAA